MTARRRGNHSGAGAGAGAGAGIDIYGNAVVDPTENVIALNDAANKRQDDLRELNNRYLASEIKRLESEAGHLAKMSKLRADHAKEINALESNRLNAIRQVDVLAVNTAADRAAAAIQALAATTAANADNLRNALTATAATIATQTNATVVAITERIAALEKSSYEGKGKQMYADPQMMELMAEMKGLRESRAGAGGKSEGLSTAWGVIIAVAGMVFAAAAIFLKK